mmetsp:Transcript_41358/g.127838  ORF Transcript_41358/g.127838 Transcript_41358/m.127838 type:complete len:376 (-) Transcript_41358:281-1408(-)
MPHATHPDWPKPVHGGSDPPATATGLPALSRGVTRRLTPWSRRLGSMATTKLSCASAGSLSTWFGTPGAGSTVSACGYPERRKSSPHVRNVRPPCATRCMSSIDRVSSWPVGDAASVTSSSGWAAVAGVFRRPRIAAEGTTTVDEPAGTGTGESRLVDDKSMCGSGTWNRTVAVSASSVTAGFPHGSKKRRRIGGSCCVTRARRRWCDASDDAPAARHQIEASSSSAVMAAAGRSSIIVVCASDATGCTVLPSAEISTTVTCTATRSTGVCAGAAVAVLVYAPRPREPHTAIEASPSTTAGSSCDGSCRMASAVALGTPKASSAARERVRFCVRDRPCRRRKAALAAPLGDSCVLASAGSHAYRRTASLRKASTA